MKIFWKVILQVLLVFSPIVSLIVFLSNKIVGVIGGFILFASVVLMYKFGVRNPEPWILFVAGLVLSIISRNIWLIEDGYETLLEKIETATYGATDDE